jgi:hypothetical protein
MHTWFILRWAWALVLIAYLILHVVLSGRLRGQARKRSGNIFAAVVVLAVGRTLIRYALGVGIVYRLSVIVVGVAAGIAALFLIHALLTLKPGDAEVEADGEGRIQSLKLS